MQDLFEQHINITKTGAIQIESDTFTEMINDNSNKLVDKNGNKLFSENDGIFTCKPGDFQTILETLIGERLSPELASSAKTILFGNISADKLKLKRAGRTQYRIAAEAFTYVMESDKLCNLIANVNNLMPEFIMDDMEIIQKDIKAHLRPRIRYFLLPDNKRAALKTRTKNTEIEIIDKTVGGTIIKSNEKLKGFIDINPYNEIHYTHVPKFIKSRPKIRNTESRNDLIFDLFNSTSGEWITLTLPLKEVTEPSIWKNKFTSFTNCLLTSPKSKDEKQAFRDMMQEVLDQFTEKSSDMTSAVEERVISLIDEYTLETDYIKWTHDIDVAANDKEGLTIYINENHISGKIKVIVTSSLMRDVRNADPSTKQSEMREVLNAVQYQYTRGRYHHRALEFDFEFIKKWHDYHKLLEEEKQKEEEFNEGQKQKLDMKNWNNEDGVVKKRIRNTDDTDQDCPETSEESNNNTE
ncbi:hypothetical protein [Methanococcoides methylutens]|uniref:Uncharacterized protein n=1 Tax=Methanococcoides methylutens MM1 TaxID=1434104 RepID=A0A0E3STJ0_METMT|nr:hypothetical protein [Methanococcoides methylutens]AKB85987.1 hypothetical protein MCMEM_1934 [Methanococcoides methylutens MM1]